MAKSMDVRFATHTAIAMHVDVDDDDGGWTKRFVLLLSLCVHIHSLHTPVSVQKFVCRCAAKRERTCSAQLCIHHDARVTL